METLTRTTIESNVTLPWVLHQEHSNFEVRWYEERYFFSTENNIDHDWILSNIPVSYGEIVTVGQPVLVLDPTPHWKCAVIRKLSNGRTLVKYFTNSEYDMKTVYEKCAQNIKVADFITYSRFFILNNEKQDKLPSSNLYPHAYKNSFSMPYSLVCSSPLSPTYIGDKKSIERLSEGILEKHSIILNSHLENLEKK